MQARARYAEYLRKAYQETRSTEGRSRLYPAGARTAPQTWVVEAVDQWQEQHDLLRWWRKRQSRKERSPVRQLIEAYEAATGTCFSCD
jgi:hypothetical protein